MAKVNLAEGEKPAFTAVPDEFLVNSKYARLMAGGVSVMCVWRWIRDPNVQMPAPVKINGRNYWKAGDLRTWNAARLNRTSA